MQEGDRTTTSGMDCVEGRYSTNQQETCAACYRSIVYLSVGPPESRRSTQLHRVSSLSIRRTVLFNCNITVFTPIDWPADAYRDARRGNWIRTGQNSI